MEGVPYNNYGDQLNCGLLILTRPCCLEKQIIMDIDSLSLTFGMPCSIG